MTAARGTSLTLGEAARRLDMDVDALPEMVYSGQLPAHPQDGTGRLLLVWIHRLDDCFPSFPRTELSPSAPGVALIRPSAYVSGAYNTPCSAVDDSGDVVSDVSGRADGS